MVSYKEMTDFELIDKFKNGDQFSFNEIVKRYQKRIYMVIRRMVDDHDDADDIMQDVFIKVHDSLKNFRGESGIYTWMYRIAVNLSINFLNKKKLRKFFHYEDLIQPLISSDEKPDDTMERKEKAELIEKAIESLPQKQKLAFVMRYYDDMSYEEISKILKKSVGALKANYFHAFKKIEEYIKSEVQRSQI
jgi:RNA polymerase sigma factor (sigma-70 family)